jgi:hypothetical protein
MSDKPEAKRPPKRWKRVVKWTLGTIFVALILWGLVAYWTQPMTATATLLILPIP